MTGADVIDKLLEYYNLNGKTLSEKIGLARPQLIYDLQHGKIKSVSPKLSMKIISVFPEINRSWLLSGEGEMLKGAVTPQQPETNPKNDMTIEEFIKELERRDKQIEELLSQNSKLLQILSNAQEQHALIMEKYLRLTGDSGRNQASAERELQNSPPLDLR